MEDELSLMTERGEEITEDDLNKRLKELKCSNAALQAENHLFERFIGRLDAQELVSQAGGDGPGGVGVSHLEGGIRVTSNSPGRRRRSRSNIPDRLLQLTLEQKLYVVQREVAETRQEQEELKRRYGRIQDNYKAALKEAEMRLTEIRKAKNEFERRVVKPLKENRLEMKDSEKVLQFMEDKSKVTQLDKFKLKNQALKVQEKKLQQQIHHKKEMGKAYYEDFFQDNTEQRLRKDLDELQVNNLKAHRVLSSHKDKLQSVSLESMELSSEIIKRKQMLAKIEEEIQSSEEERLKEEALNKHLRRQMTDYQAPDIIEYMHIKDKHKRLQKSIHTWERKVGVAEMALKSQSKAWSTQRTTLTPVNSADAGARSGQHYVPVKLPCITEHGT